MYTTIENIENILGSLTSQQSAYFTSVLSPAIDAYIDKQTETQFASTEPTTVYVSGDDASLLTIPTMHDITAVKDEDDQIISSDSYMTFPSGSDNKIAIRNKGGSWTKGLDNYSVTGVLGYADLPDEIIAVATDLATSFFSVDASGLKSERVGDWSATYETVERNVSGRSQDVLDSYRRLSRSI